MTDVDVATPVAVGRRRTRRVIVGLLVSLVLIAGLASYLVVRHLDDQYGPVEAGSFGGVYSDRGFAFSGDGSSYRLAATPGATGELIESLDNRGAHAVTVTSIERGDSVASIRWSVYREVPGGYVTGIETPWQSFPAHIPAHGTIRLLITIQRPSNCVTGESYSGSHFVHWDSLLANHTTDVDLQLFRPGGLGIPLC